MQKVENRKNTEKVLQISRKVVKYKCGAGEPRKGERKMMMTITALNLKTNKHEPLRNTGEKDIHGKVIWETKRGNKAELTTSRHFGKTRYFFYEIEEG